MVMMEHIHSICAPSLVEIRPGAAPSYSSSARLHALSKRDIIPQLLVRA